MLVATSLPIGGFFELELPAGPARPHPRAAAALASGRACLGLFARVAGPAHLWVPFYICDSVLAALTAAGVGHSFYALDENLELLTLPELAEHDYLLYVNYFGLKTSYAASLASHYRTSLLLDLTQAFFEEPASEQWAFNSARKFFGVPDGGYVYAPAGTTLPGLPRNEAISVEHLLRRHLGEQSAAYAAYSAYEEITPYVPSRMSAVSETWLSWLDYEAVAQQRQANFRLYHELLSPLLVAGGPALPWLPMPAGAVPFCYPLRLREPLPDRHRLFEQRIFVPWLWPEMRHRPERGFAREQSLVDGVLALPLDHRYGPAEVAYVVEAVQALLAARL